ncbi:MAG: helix-turn-helix domain-containing protein [Dysgonomonas sp.]
MVGKYERGDNRPSIEVIARLAKVLEVSVDYLLGEGLNAAYDKQMLKRLDEIQRLPQEAKQHIFEYIDDYKGL